MRLSSRVTTAETQGERSCQSGCDVPEFAPVTLARPVPLDGLIVRALIRSRWARTVVRGLPGDARETDISWMTHPRGTDVRMIPAANQLIGMDGRLVVDVRCAPVMVETLSALAKPGA